MAPGHPVCPENKGLPPLLFVTGSVHSGFLLGCLGTTLSFGLLHTARFFLFSWSFLEVDIPTHERACPYKSPSLPPGSQTIPGHQVSRAYPCTPNLMPYSLHPRPLPHSRPPCPLQCPSFARGPTNSSGHCSGTVSASVLGTGGSSTTFLGLPQALRDLISTSSLRLLRSV